MLIAVTPVATQVLQGGPATDKKYFGPVYQSPLKKSNFDAWYRGIKANQILKKAIHGLIKANDEFFRENPDYVEGAMCGRLRKDLRRPSDAD